MLKNKTETIYCFPVVPITFIMNIPKVLLQICRSVESPFQIVVGPDLHGGVLTSVSIDLEVFLDQKNHLLFEDVSVWICVLICFLDVRPLDFDTGV